MKEFFYNVYILFLLNTIFFFIISIPYAQIEKPFKNFIRESIQNSGEKKSCDFTHLTNKETIGPEDLQCEGVSTPERNLYSFFDPYLKSLLSIVFFISGIFVFKKYTKKSCIWMGFLNIFLGFIPVYLLFKAFESLM